MHFTIFTTYLLISKYFSLGMIATRNKIIVIADQLIRQRGYNAFSYADIATKLKLKNAAIHYHFPSKGELGKAVIEETREKFKKHIDEWKHSSIQQQLTSFFEMYGKNSKHNCICFMGALGAAYNTLPKEMAATLKIAHQEISTWLTKLIRQGQKKGIFQTSSSPEKITNLITSSLLASLILQRVSKQPHLQNVQQILLNEILNH